MGLLNADRLSGFVTASCLQNLHDHHNIAKDGYDVGR
jgi:hypothetical protein